MEDVNDKFGFILATKTLSNLVKLSLYDLLAEFNLCDKLYLDIVGSVYLLVIYI